MRCFSCHRPVRPPTRDACIYCGGLPVPQEDLPSLRMQLEEGVRGCPTCKILVPPSSPHCNKCGGPPMRLNFDSSLNEGDKRSLLSQVGQGTVELLFDAAGVLLSDW